MSDLIKREDAIGACAYETIECYEARKAIRALPSADRPQGEWEDTGKDPSHSHPLTGIGVLSADMALTQRQTSVLTAGQGCLQRTRMSLTRKEQTMSFEHLVIMSLGMIIGLLFMILHKM